MIKTIYEAEKYETGKIYPLIECVKRKNKLVALNTPVIFIKFDNDEKKAIVKDFYGNRFNVPISNLSECEFKKCPSTFKVIKDKLKKIEYKRNELQIMLSVPKFAISDENGELVDIAFSSDAGIVSIVPLNKGNYRITEI